MYLRVVRGRTKPGQVDEFARRWKEFAGTTLTGMPGFRHGYLAGNRDTNRLIGVTVWETKPDPERADQAMKQMAERARDIIDGPPEPEDYEVLVDV